MTCQAAAVGGLTPHPHPPAHPHPRAADTLKHGLPGRARTSLPPSGSTCDASLRSEAGQEPGNPDAASQRPAEATRAPPPLHVGPVPAHTPSRGSRPPPPRGAQRGLAAHEPRSAQPSPSGA